MRRKGARCKPPSIPFIFKHFNVSGHYLTNDTGIGNIINRFTHLLVEALNTRPKLPKYILVIPDDDIANYFKKVASPSIMIGATIHDIIKQLDTFLSRRLDDLMAKKDGAVPPGKKSLLKSFGFACSNDR